MKQSPRPTLKTIAKRLRVSVTTLSRAFNGKAEEYGISKKTEEAVRRAAKKLHFSPDPLARSLLLEPIQSPRGPTREGVVLPTRLVKRASVRRIGKSPGL